MAQTLNWTSFVDTTAPVEHDRLELMQEVFDPVSARLLDRVGVQPGWDCLEVGAGAGSVARMLAERAGAEHVTATDLSTEFLGPLADLGVRVLRHDVTRDESPGRFDLIHSRAVLEHVTEQDRVLARLVSWLKPGGWLVVESSSPVPELSSDPTVGRALDVFGRLMTELVGTDPGWARTLPLPLARAGLVDCRAEGHAIAMRGGSAAARWLAACHRLVEEPALASGALSPAELDHVHAAYANPAFVDHTWLLVGAVGRTRRP